MIHSFMRNFGQPDAVDTQLAFTVGTGSGCENMSTNLIVFCSTE